MPFQRPLGERAGNQTPPTFIRPLQDKRCIVGQRILLECQIEGHPDPVVKWLKDGQNVTQCPDYEISQERNRYHLEIRSAQGSDCGRFTIQAMNAAGIKQSTCMLIVAPAPTPVPGAGMSVTSSPAPMQTPVGPSAPFFLKELKHQPLHQGALTVFEARVVGIPQPEIEWLKDGKPLDNYRAKREHDAQTGICALTIPQVFNEDMGEYTCKASNDNGLATSSAHSEILRGVKLMDKAQFEKWFSEERLQITKERRQKLVSGVPHMPPHRRATPQLVVGARTGTPLYVQRQLVDHVGTLSPPPPVQTQPTQHVLSQEGAISPMAMSQESNGAVTTPTTTIAPIFKSQLRGLRLTEGTDAILQCSIVGVPKPKITWMKNGRPIAMSSRVQSQYTGSLALLKMSMMSPDDSGEYRIFAENPRGKAQSSARIEVYPLNATPQSLIPSPLSPQQPSSLPQQACQREQERQLRFEQREQRGGHQRSREDRERDHLLEQSRRYQQEQERLREQQERQLALQRERELRQDREERRYKEELRAQQLRQQTQRREEEEHLLGEYRHLEELQRQLAEQQQLPSAPLQSRTTVRKEVDDYFWDLQQPGSPYVHPYKRAPEQVEYFLEQQQRELERRRTMAPIQPPQKPSGGARVQNGTAPSKPAPPLPPQKQVAGRPAGQQQQQQQQLAAGGKRKLQPEPSPEPREQITLRKVDRYKQSQSAKRLATDEDQLVPSKEPPKFLSQLKSSLQLNEGQQVMLDCKFSPTDDPNLKIAWLLNGKAILASSRITTIFEFGYAVLEINPVTVFDEGEYTIVAVNTRGEARQSAVLEVLGPAAPQKAAKRASAIDRPNFHSEPRSQEIFEGQPLQLETKVTPVNDPKLQVEFSLNGNRIKSDGRVQTKVQNGFAVLSIAEAKQSDAGYYVFKAVNDAGVAETDATVVVLPRAKEIQLDNRQVVDVEDVREAQSGAAGYKLTTAAPKFVSQLQAFRNEEELGRSYFDARIQPTNDPTLRVSWLKDGNPLQNANRIHTVSNFGFVSLTIHPTYPEDAGVYTCVLINSLGQAQSSAPLTTIAAQPLQLEPFHEQSLNEINVIEGQEIHIGPVLRDRPEESQSMQAPRIARPMTASVKVEENEPVHLECRVQPANDVKLKVEWLFNGAPLAAAHRFRPMADFGYVALDILYAYPEDSGTYTVVARNELGEAQCSAQLDVIGAKGLYLDAQHPEGLERIQELEQPRYFGLQEVPDRQCESAPKFVDNLPSVELDEMDDLVFELKLTPVNDPTMLAEWSLNGQPLYSGFRFHAKQELGLVRLSVKGVIPEDAGEYKCVASNALGSDSRQCTVAVQGKEAILTDTQHQESLGKIDYLESLEKFPRREIPDVVPTSGPRFVQQLPGNVGEVEEGEPLHLECKVEPLGDNTLIIYWLRDGQPLAHANRLRAFHDFGFISLDFLHVNAEDAGKYTCVAENALGRAETSAQFACQPKSRVLGDVQHPTSYQRIQEIEAPKPLPEEAPEPAKRAPFFTKPLSSQQSLQVQEGDNVFLEAQAGPVDDNTLIYEWYINDQPLPKAHRFVLSQDFGFAALSLLYMYPEDSGTYTLAIRNAVGEARSSVKIECAAKDALLKDTFHPSSIARIEELEAPRPEAEEQPESAKQAPKIEKPLTSTLGEAVEAQALHLEAQYAPVDDNKLRVEWYLNGAPLKHSNRHRFTNDFGYAALDIDFLIAQDEGDYAIVVSNEAGQAQSATSVKIQSHEVIQSQTTHPESLRRIQEIEAVRPAEPTEPELPPQPPQFVQQLSGPSEQLKEGQALHLDCSVQPINDPKLRIEWYYNGSPLKSSSRLRTIHDFGHVALEFLHLLAEDAGTYTCRAVNEAGEATTNITLQVESKRNIYLETQHEQSWVHIQEIENRQPIREPSPELKFPPPQFTTPLQNPDELVEGESLHLECRLQPVNDPTLKVTWTCDGRPLPEANRFLPARNLDMVTLDIVPIYGEDSGTYQCQAVSAFGQAATSASVKCQPTAALLLDTQHQQSWQQIQDYENRPVPEALIPDLEITPPRFVVNLTAAGATEFQEGDPVYLEAQIEPTNDNQLVVEWFFNGAPLSLGSRFKTVHEFGYVALSILGAYAQDDGTFTCKIRNSKGQAESSVAVKVASKDSLFTQPQHPTSWQKIQELEAPKPGLPEPEVPAVGAPQFIGPLQSLETVEGQPAHFETRVQPVVDNKLVVQWVKDGQPLPNSNRFRFANDFGLVSLHVAHTVANDSGTYGVVATNEQGQAQVQGQLKVSPVESILSSTQHESSWKRIQEIEAPKAAPEEVPEADKGPPKFTQQLNSISGLTEGERARFEAQVQPSNDPRLRIKWFHDGKPLVAGNRFSQRNDFGHVTMEFTVRPGDVGEYKCVATNAHGEAFTQARVDCESKPSLLLDTQHQASWKRIQEIEAPKPLAPEPEPAAFGKPQFTQPLQSLADVPEGSVAAFEARLVPTNDPSMQTQWFLNDTPLMQSNRFVIHENFGQVTLRINGTSVHDAGVYSCKAVNKEGAAITNASLSVAGGPSLLLDPAHKAALKKIQELEAVDRFPQLAYPDQQFQKPQWVRGFEGVDVGEEGGVVQLSGQLEPAADPTMRVEWFLNGVPLQNANRFRSDLNFGSVTFYIIHVLPNDSGVYSCRAYNQHGDATTSATVKVAGYEAIMGATQHPESWERIQELERPKIVEEVEVVEEKVKPHFLTQLESATDLQEGTPIRLEATFQPARDNNLRVQWEFNGQPLGASQLIKTRSELGWACLEIGAVNLDHVGVYTLKVVNTEGEAASSASVKVAGIGDILAATQHDESWRQIQILEAPKERTPSPPPPEYDAPTIQKQIQNIECNEGEPSRFEAAFLPNNDPNVKVLWVRNGEPLAHGSKYAISQDFGYCTLAIGYTFPEDEGVYQLCVSNAKGEAVTSATLKCHPKEAIIGDVQHEESWRRIQEIEAPRDVKEEVEPSAKGPPKFTSQILSVSELVEGQPSHFETTVEPADDANVRITWLLNGQPVSASSRLKMIADFGYIILNINDTEQRDTGEWTCVATNTAGEARTSTKLTVKGKESLLLDPISEKSLAKIQDLEAPRPPLEEQPAPQFESPKITLQLTVPSDAEEGDSAHLEAHYTPVADPKLRVEWYKDGQPIHQSNRFKMVSDFGFAILDILYLLAHDAGEYKLRVVNEAGEASTSAKLAVTPKESLLLAPQDEKKAHAVQQLEDYLHRRPEEVEAERKERMPVFVQPLSAPAECVSGDSAHFSARYEPVDDNQLKVLWFHGDNNRPLLTGSRVKAISEFGYVVLEISPVYPEDSGDYVCKAVNAVGEAVTSTSLKCTPREAIDAASQLPKRMSGAQKRIHELETQRPLEAERPDLDHGAPKFVSQLPSLPQLSEGALVRLEAQVQPVADPHLRVEWFHDGQPVRNTSRMKASHDFGAVLMELIAEPQDNGTWTCRATNKHGQAESSCKLEVIGESGVSYEWVSPGERRERIEQLEGWLGRPKGELAEAVGDFGPPKFTQQLADLGELGESEATSFVCVVEPVGDPTLQIDWEHNGHPVPYSNRIQMTNEFGVISLIIKHLITLDSGEYRCIARNAKGEASTTGRVLVHSIVEVEEPRVTQPLVQNVDADEGESVHLECRVGPINDPKLIVQWFHNGQPLADASRFRQAFEFGFVTLDLLYAYPEDNGDYELVVRNDKGRASTRSRINVSPKPALEFQPQAPGSNVDNLEHHLRQFTRASVALNQDDAYNPTAVQPPVFKAQLNNVGVEEGDFCRFETQLAPINDPYMKVEWFKDGKPVVIGTRFRNTLDYGFACLDLLYALPDDTGEYACVATNKHGQAMLTAKLACSGARRVVTDTQIPQGVNVRDIKKDKLHWMDTQGEQARKKQAPQFTIKPRDLQVNENQPGRFECAVVGWPRPKVTWYINNNQALQGHRYRLHYDGVHYLTIPHTRISDAGTVECIARNSEGEVHASAHLDVFQIEDFRQHKLRMATLKTSDEMAQRELQWHRDTLGQLGEAFEKAPKGDIHKLAKVERSKSPIEPLETEELMQKFTRAKDDAFYDKLTYIEKAHPEFPGLELEQVELKAGKIEPYVPPEERMESVKLKGAPTREARKEPGQPPDWAAGGSGVKLGEPAGRVRQTDEVPKEPEMPARDQVKLREAKPKPADEQAPVEHVTIEEEKAKLTSIRQGPEIEQEKFIPHADQVKLKAKFQPKAAKPGEPVTLEGGDLRGTPAVVKEEIPKSSVPNKPQPTKMGETAKAAPAIQTHLKPAKAELGRSAVLVVNFSGDSPVTVKWFHNGKELRSAFDTQIKTTDGESRLELNKIKQSHAGDYSVKLSNVGGECESKAALTVSTPAPKGVTPAFKQRVADQRAKQGAPIKLSCSISGDPRPTITWFKDGQQLPNDGRFQMADSEAETSLTITDVVPPDAGIYECVAKNVAGEVRCKARLNVILAKTGKEAEAGPKLEAPRFTGQIQPVVGQEGGNAEFRAKYIGFPEPTIRWSRNNEPVKEGRNAESGYANGDAWLKISNLSNEDAAEYKCDASNPAGKATTIANLVLKPAAGKVIGGKPGVYSGKGAQANGSAVQKKQAPQFLQKLIAINAKAGENVKFSAEFDGQPEPAVQWSFNGRQLTGGRDHKISVVGNKASLEMSKVTPANAGSYVCILRNPSGTTQSEAKLNVIRKRLRLADVVLPNFSYHSTEASSHSCHDKGAPTRLHANHTRPRNIITGMSQQHPTSNGPSSSVPPPLLHVVEESKLPAFTAISKLKPNMKSLNMNFIVLDVGAPRQTSQGNEVRNVRVADLSGSIFLSLWNEAGAFFKSGDMCRLRGGLTTIHRGVMSLSVSKTGELVKVGEFLMAYADTPDMSTYNAEWDIRTAPADKDLVSAT